VLWATSTDAIGIMDEQGTIRYANPADADVFVIRRAAGGNNFAIVEPERLAEAHRRGVRRLLQNEGKSLTGVRRRRSPCTGRDTIPSESRSVIFSEEGGRNVLAGFHSRYLGSQKIEDALRQREAQWRRRKELAQLGSWSLGCTLGWITWSQDWLRISDCRQRQLVSRKFSS